DNSRYNARKPDDSDRSGHVLSVPFYRPDGELAGCVSGVILTNAVKDLLPDSNYVLINKELNVALVPDKQGRAGTSMTAVKQGISDPALIYSEVQDIEVADAAGKWLLWAGIDDAAFLGRADVKAAQLASSTMIASAIAAGFVGAGLVGFIRSRLLARALESQRQQNQVEQVLAAAAAAAGGDLTATINIKDQGVIGQLAQAFNGLITSMRSAVQEIARTASHLGDATSKLGDAESTLNSASKATVEEANRAAEAGELVRSGVSG
ncbi:MAG: methyl-accepting chemotaxis protein, partial [Planctomycetota bacterium]|nr:methyl-accepting chemotaxis protein [Planctomycetota bacterium]